jgi:hypothetical protein
LTDLDDEGLQMTLQGDISDQLHEEIESYYDVSTDAIKDGLENSPRVRLAKKGD